MEDSISLQDAMTALKGNFTATVITIGDLESGTTNSRDWTKKNITIEDVSERVTFAAWGDEIKLFDLGKTYDFENAWFKMYDGKPTLAIGKYCKVILNENPAVPHPGPSTVGQEQLPAAAAVPAISAALKEFVLSENILIIQIEKVITAQHEELGIPFNGQQIGMHTREIYLQARKTNLIKASNMS